MCGSQGVKLMTNLKKRVPFELSSGPWATDLSVRCKNMTMGLRLIKKKSHRNIFTFRCFTFCLPMLPFHESYGIGKARARRSFYAVSEGSY